MNQPALWTAQASHESFIEDNIPVNCGPVIFKKQGQCILASVEGYDFIMYAESATEYSLCTKIKDGALDGRAQMGRSNATFRQWFFSVAPVPSNVYDNEQNPVLLLLAP